jgi:hypothetical protein
MNKPVFLGQLSGQSSLHRHERRPVSMRASIATGDGSRAEALVLDLSHDGCGIETSMTLAPGQPVRLCVDGEEIFANVRWYAGGKAGLVFDTRDPDEVEKKSRTHDRGPIALTASMRRLGMPAYRVEVSDLSPEGCKVGVIERPRTGEHLLMKFDELEPIECEVVWVEDYFAGLRFERPIHAAVFDLMVQRLTARA